MKDKVQIIIFLIALFLAFIIRFYMLGEAPNGLYLDEAGHGYSAYSILQTGKDEFGKELPVIFRSFTDFKTPVYIYSLVPLISLFGLTKFTVRFPSFFFGILILPIIFLLIKKITPKKDAYTLSILTALLLAISPWHILYSRSAFECSVALFFFISGIYFFYKGLRKPVYIIVSSILLAIAIPTYNAQRVITPLFTLILYIRHRKTLFSKPYTKFLVIAFALAFLVLLPSLTVATTPGFWIRATGLNIFSPEKIASSGRISEIPILLEPVVNNSLYISLKEFTSLYVAYFSPRNLFFLGDYDKRTSFPDLATFFIWQFPFYILGFYKLIKDKREKELRFFTLTLLFISPLPAAITRDPYSTIRSLHMVIPLLIIISLGILESWRAIKQKYLKTLAIVTFTLTIVYSLGKLYSSGIILNEYYRASEWNYGWEEVTKSIKTLNTDLPIIVDSARYKPYIQLLFFLEHNPAAYQKENFEVDPGEYYTNMQRLDTWRIGNITVKPLDWKHDTIQKQYLIGDKLAISDGQIEEHNLTLIKDILYPDGVIAFRIVGTNPN